MADRNVFMVASYHLRLPCAGVCVIPCVEVSLIRVARAALAWCCLVSFLRSVRSSLIREAVPVSGI